MAVGYPYHPSTGAIRRIVEQFRSAFPQKVNADTLKKWTIAPKNESVLLNVLRFLKLIDADGNKVPDNAKLFLDNDVAAFANKFGVLVKTASTDLFSHFGDKAWVLPKDKLIGYFRSTDESSDTVGQLQAACFQTLATFAGHSPTAGGATKSSTVRTTLTTGKSKTSKKAVSMDQADGKFTSDPAAGNEKIGGANGVNLTVRIELNLPVSDDQISLRSNI